MAQDALRAARLALGEQLYADAVSRAYYAMLDAARAALSEHDLYAKTHKGTWMLLHKTFIEPGELDQIWSKRADRARELRQGGDYEAVRPSPEATADVVAWAEEFVELIALKFGGGTQRPPS